jgi:hypothetical protein
MADTKSRGGKKQGHEKQPTGKKHLGTHTRTDSGKRVRGQIDTNTTKARGEKS